MPVSPDYLIPQLRLQLGDTNPATYRYLYAWLSTALVASISALQRWWNFKYLVDPTTNEVYRNPASPDFLSPEPPIIQNSDERPIILMAAIIVQKGDLQNSSWNLASWRDAEISYSNLQMGTIKQFGLTQDWNELMTLLTPPNKKLSFSKKGHLPGFHQNTMEYD